jgi:hypothetical protein
MLWVKAAGIAVDSLLLAISLFYLLFAIKTPDVVYISDLDYSRRDYRIIISALVFMQIANTCAYAFMIKRDDYEFPIVMVSMLAAAVGWSIVTFASHGALRDERNHSPLHLLGARLYVFGHFAACLCLFRDIVRTSHSWWTIGLMTFCLILITTFGIVFAINKVWVIEHALFMTFLLAHLIISISSVEAGRGLSPQFYPVPTAVLL